MARFVCLRELSLRRKKWCLGNRQIEDRVVSLHDPSARPIKKGSVRNPVQFGRKLGLCESAEIT